MMAPTRKLFTIEEANALIPFLQRGLDALRKQVRDIIRLKRQLEVLNLICDSQVNQQNLDFQEMVLGVVVDLSYENDVVASQPVDERIKGYPPPLAQVNDLAFPEMALCAFNGGGGRVEQLCLCAGRQTPPRNNRHEEYTNF